jgi:hypothetical protein
MPRRKKDAATKVGKRRVEWVPPELKQPPEDEQRLRELSADWFANGMKGDVK